ncbi:hypothetical protein Tco_0488630 [Tanacetum coccineum]
MGLVFSSSTRQRSSALAINFFNDKPSDAENEKTTADTEVESMVSVSIQQDTSVIPLMTSPVIGRSRFNKLELLDLPKSDQESKRFNESFSCSLQGSPSSDMKELCSNACWRRTMKRDMLTYELAYEALQVSIRRDECEDFDVDKAQEETKKKSKQDSLKTPPGSPPFTATPLHHRQADMGAFCTSWSLDFASSSSPPICPHT